VKSKDRIIIFDTTLRDGEQSPGASLNINEKLEIAAALARLRVDVIEAGFPVSSPEQFESVRLIAGKIKGVVITGLARVMQKDIDQAALALKKAGRPRIHVFVGTSPIHMKYQLRMTENEVFSRAVWAVKYCRRFTDDVEFSPMDATRSKRDFLFRVVEGAIKAGANVVNIPDTVGYTTPDEFAALISDIKANIPGAARAVISVHCHNDLGLAVANSLAAVKAGAGQIECSVNGIGERAGNTSLEEVVMAVKTRKDFFGKTVGVKTEEIYRTSRLVSALTGIPVQPNKAIVGANAFAHESGIHQDGVLKKSSTFEIMSPRTIGLKSGRIVLGKHSGRHAFMKKLRELGCAVRGAEFEKAFTSFKNLADKKKEVFDEDVEALIEEHVKESPQAFRLEYIQVTTGNNTVPTATVRIKTKGATVQEASCGDGPVDAAYKAIDRITKISAGLVDYSLKAVTRGKDALGEVSVKIADRKGRIMSGRGISTDIIEASALAYLNALNRLASRR